MKVTTIEMPPSVGINKLEQGVYEFDMTLLHVDVPGFENGYYILPVTTNLQGPAYFYLRIGYDAFPQAFPRMYRQESFKLGKFSKLWVEGNALRGTVSIPQHLHSVFDRMVALCEGEVIVGVCSIVDQSIDQQGLSRKRITEVLGCQVLTKDGNNLNTPYSESYSPLYAMMEQVDLEQRGYFIDAARSIAASPHVEVRMPKEVPPPKEPCVACQGTVVADTHVKGLSEKVAVLAKSREMMLEISEEVSEKVFDSENVEATEELVELLKDEKDGA